MSNDKRTIVSPSNIELGETSVPSPTSQTEIVNSVSPPSSNNQTESVHISAPPSKFHTKTVYIPRLVVKQKASLPIVQTSKASIPPSKSKAHPIKPPNRNSLQVSTNVLSSKNRYTVTPIRSTTPTVYAYRNKNSENRNRKVAAAAIAKPCCCCCCCSAPVLAGLLVAFMVVAAIIIPLTIVLTSVGDESTTT
ncbi:unnamed protein product, partial [Rotaria sordida]